MLYFIDALHTQMYLMCPRRVHKHPRLWRSPVLKFKLIGIHSQFLRKTEISSLPTRFSSFIHTQRSIHCSKTRLNNMLSCSISIFLIIMSRMCRWLDFTRKYVRWNVLLNCIMWLDGWGYQYLWSLLARNFYLNEFY